MCSGVLLDLLLFVCLDNWFNLISLHSNNLSFTTTQILFCFWFCSAVQFMLLSQTHHQHLFQQQKQHYHRSPSPLSDLIVEFHLSKKVNFVWLTWCVTSWMQIRRVDCRQTGLRSAATRRNRDYRCSNSCIERVRHPDPGKDRRCRRRIDPKESSRLAGWENRLKAETGTTMIIRSAKCY